MIIAVAAFIIGATATEDSEIITAPRPGEEYVFVQSSASGARPIQRKEKKAITAKDAEAEFESSHKIPTALTFASKEESKVKREAKDPSRPAPPPVEAITIDPLKLLEKYKHVLATSTDSQPTSSTTSSIILTTGKLISC